MNRLLLFFLLSFLFYSCSKRSEISGIIDNYAYQSNDSIELKLNFGHYSTKFEKYSSPISINGEFSIKPEINDFRFGNISYNNTELPIILTPDKKIKLIIYRDSVQYTNSPINDFLKQRPFLEVYPHYDSIQNDLKFSPRKFLEYSEKEKSKEISTLNKIRKSLATKEYNFLKNEIDYYYLNLIIYAGFCLKWYGNAELYNDKWIDLQDSLISYGLKRQQYHIYSNSFNFFLLQSFQFNNENFIKTKSEDFWVKEAGLKNYQEYLIKNEFDRINLDYLIVSKNTLDKKKLEKALANRLLESIEFDYYENLQCVYNYFQNEFPESKYLPEISKKITPILKFKNDQQIDGVYFFPTNHNYTSIDSVLNRPEFKNKVVLVDIWGSWCSSCRTEFKYLPALKEKLKDKNIEYLYVANQKNHSIEKWKEVINYHKVKGYHMLGNKELLADLWKYNPECLGYYPTYMIFDKNKNLILPCAAYPSEKELYYQLLNALEVK